jgi:hypothetical protein
VLLSLLWGISDAQDTDARIEPLVGSGRRGDVALRDQGTIKADGDDPFAWTGCITTMHLTGPLYSLPVMAAVTATKLRLHMLLDSQVASPASAISLNTHQSARHMSNRQSHRRYL